MVNLRELCGGNEDRIHFCYPSTSFTEEQKLKPNLFATFWRLCRGSNHAIQGCPDAFTSGLRVALGKLPAPMNAGIDPRVYRPVLPPDLALVLFSE